MTRVQTQAKVSASWRFVASPVNPVAPFVEESARGVGRNDIHHHSLGQGETARRSGLLSSLAFGIDEVPPSFHKGKCMSEKSSRRIRLEVCVASLDDVDAAERGGADRLELNAALGLGGLTPSLGALIEVKQTTRLPVVAMIRPRPGGFAYSPADLRVMERDADLCLQHDAEGLAFGFLKDDGRVDESRCRAFLSRIPTGRESVFHRAFDVTPDPFEALETLIGLGLTRILTSGQEESAYAGAELIRRLINRAEGRIEILPAGGINRFTLRDVVERTRCDQVHGSLRTTLRDPSTSARPSIGFGAAFKPSEDRFDTTDLARVLEIRALLDR